MAFIRIAQQVGVSLEEIRDALAALPENRTPTKADWARLSARWRRKLEERIALMERLRDQLTGCIGCGCLSLQRCKLINPERPPGRPGPRRPDDPRSATRRSLTCRTVTSADVAPFVGLTSCGRYLDSGAVRLHLTFRKLHSNAGSRLFSQPGAREMIEHHL